MCGVCLCTRDGVFVCDDGRRKGCLRACLAQSVERKTLNLVVVGSSPTVGTFCLCPLQRWVTFLHVSGTLSGYIGHGEVLCHVGKPMGMCTAL